LLNDGGDNGLDTPNSGAKIHISFLETRQPIATNLLLFTSQQMNYEKPIKIDA
jgi:hypothetical protein